MTAPAPHLHGHVLDRLVLDTSPYLSCEECFERVDAHVEALAADPGYRDPVLEAHLAGCPACAEEAASLTALVTE